MSRMEGARLVALLAVVLGGSTVLEAGCVSDFERSALAGRPCPCLPGWVCDETQGAAGVCVERSLGAGGSLNVTSGPIDAGLDAAVWPPVPGRDASSAPGDGETPDAASAQPLPDAGTPSGAGQCGVAAAPTGAGCPAVCDDCTGGICHIRCDDTRDCSGTSQAPFGIACPAGFHCEVSCSDDDNCKSASVACSGEQACDVLCTGKKTCIGLSLACAGGPCSLHCGNGAQVCRDSTISCGEDACQSICEGSDSPAVIGCETSCSAACGC